MAHILVAEDDQSLCQFLTGALERAGYKVTSAHDGLQAWQLLENSGPFDLLLSDIVMPGMDGIELSRKAIQKHPNLKIMFITGFTASATQAGPPGMPNSTVISKPFHLNDLVTQIGALLSK